MVIFIKAFPVISHKVISAVGRGQAGWPDHDQQHCYHHAPNVKPEAVTAVVVAPDDGREDARNMLSCK